MTLRKIGLGSGTFLLSLLVLGAVSVGTAHGAPSISSISGTVSNGTTITVSGSGFGTKPTAAPLRWDDFESGIAGQFLTGWDIESTSPPYKPRYAIFKRPNTPGSMSAWQEFNNSNYNSTIGIFNYVTKKYYVSGWMNATAFGSPSRNNKLWAFRGVDGASGPEGRFDQYQTQNPDNGHKYVVDCGGGKTAEDYSVTEYPGDGKWHRMEAWIDLGTPNGNDGVYTTWMDAAEWGVTLHKTFITSDCSWHNLRIQHYYATDTAVGQGANYYWDELYVDTTLARIELGNASTWSTTTHREIQIPSAWNTGSVAATVNRGSFAPGTTAYLYVVDSTGVANANGYPVTIGGSGDGDTTPPTSPTNLAATAPSSSSISVSWTASTDNVGVTGYLVERCQGSGCTNFTQVGTPTSSPFVDTGLTANTYYNYHVRATDAAGNLSGWSNVVGATTQSTTLVACNTISPTNFSQSAYNSYGAPYDVFSSNTALVNAKCTTTDPHTINLTTGITGDTTRIVYTKGYYYANSAWNQYAGTCTGALNGEWCQGSVSATITNANLSTTSAANPAYLVGMTCSVQGGGWKCGCRDTTCANFYWQIQGAGQ